MAVLIIVEEGSTPTTPASTKWKLYPKSDGIYALDDAGVETGPFGVGGGGGGSEGLMFWDEGIPQATGTILNVVGANAALSVSGTVANLIVTPPEGTAVLSTSETGGTKFLGEDGDGTSSWKLVAGVDGWVSYSAVTPTRASADDPTYVLTFAGVDLTSLIGLGMRLKWTQNSTVRYGIVTAIAFSTNTTLTLYGGTDYNVDDTASFAISDFVYSTAKAPLGFPLTASKWSVLVSDATDYTITSPASGWHSAMDSGSLPSIDMPIGAWKAFYKAAVRVEDNTAGYARIDMTLSTTTTTETWADVTTSFSINAGLSGGGLLVNKPTAVSPNLYLELAAKDTYYFLIKPASATVVTLQVQGASSGETLIQAVCAYL